MLNCMLSHVLAGLRASPECLATLFFPNPGTKDCLPFGIDFLPPEQKVGGSNPLGRTTFQEI